MHGPAWYSSEKLDRAVRILAIGSGDVRSRLRIAVSAFGHLDEHHFPEHLRADFRAIHMSLTKRGPAPDGVKGAFDHTLDRMKNATGQRIADQIYALKENLDAYIRQQTDR